MVRTAIVYEVRESMDILEQIKAKWDFTTDLTAIKKGGQKSVYKSTVSDWGEVAVKVCTSCSERIVREIQIIQRLQTEKIARILDIDYFKSNGEEYIVIIEEFIPGGSLQDYLTGNGKCSVNEMIDLLDFLLETIKMLEENQIVHRDIKPDNIIRCENGSYKLIDFGIARDLKDVSLTATSDWSPFTPGYAAPELFGSNAKARIDSRTDLYSIGVVAYVMIKGSNPFLKPNASIFEVCVSTATMQTPLLNESNEYDIPMFKFVRSLMSREQFKRPPSAKDAFEWFCKIRNQRLEMISEEEENAKVEEQMGDFLE